MSNLSLYDLTGWPFTRSPKRHFESLTSGLPTFDSLGKG
jgi:hypothetical protein